ncbi:MAG: quinone-dependent dihydroorotate dehydrogenase [Gammaproteobacteria bacterium]|nr:quinone-dependent dihydroorotate dehydrogenase [Gammaproteobacteria bacterium]
MNAYPIIRSLLFKLDAEKAHHLSLKALKLVHKLGLARWLLGKPYTAPVHVMGLDFPNPVGLAAGLDKNGEYFEALSACGFGFVEIGTVTPLPQPGNPQPRLFRLPEAEAIINRMGFNNLGVDTLVAQVKASKFKGILGINIGKNKDTPEEKAVDDYLICLEKVYAYADYVTLNISSPNTPGLRALQFGEALDKLLQALKDKQGQLAETQGRYVPIAVKIAPDMDDDAIRQLAETFIKYHIDAVIATNTTLSRTEVEGLPNAAEQGGLSGKPVREKSDHVLQLMALYLKQQIPVIAAGGISSPEDAINKLRLGASLVQIYTGFIYQGPALIRDCVVAIDRAAMQ